MLSRGNCRFCSLAVEGVARGRDARTLLDDTDTRNEFVNELYEVRRAESATPRSQGDHVKTNSSAKAEAISERGPGAGSTVAGPEESKMTVGSAIEALVGM